MNFFRNLLFIILLFFLFCINLCYIHGKLFSSEFYFLALNFSVLFILLVETPFFFHLKDTLYNLMRDNEKLNLIISDYQTESIFLNTLTEIIETFRLEEPFEEVIEKIADAIKSIFKEETVVILIFEEKFKLTIKGKEITIPDSFLEEVTIKTKPVLINNVSSFEEYKKFLEQGIRSFLTSPLSLRGKIIGIIGVFSFKNRKFSLKDLQILRMVSAPTSLIIENTQLMEKTKLLSITDSLTAVYNRRYFEKALEEILIKARESHSSVSLSMCDIDFFKFYNDKNGHPAGDYVLKTISNILKNGVKGSDIVARYGGEEFVIVFPNTTKENALKVCEKLRKSIKEYKFPNEEKQPNKDLTLSFGVASFPEDADTSKELIKKADIALYKAKAEGKDRVIPA